MTKNSEKQKSGSRIPSANSPGALFVTDGAIAVGSVVEHDHSHFAFDPAGVLIGEYSTRLAAMRALPRVRP
jgi:hypothetical protein